MSYIDKVLSYNPTIYLPLNETGGTVAHCEVDTNQNGTTVDITWDNAIGPDGLNGAPLFNGTTSYIDIMTATLVNAWDAGGDEWTIMVWWKMYNLATWTDGSLHFVLVPFDVAPNNVYIYKSGNNQFSTWWTGGGATETNHTNPITAINWTCDIMTRSEAADEINWYRNGSLLATDTTIGNWASATPWDRMLIGTNTTVAGFWYGWLAHFAMFPAALGTGAVAGLSSPDFPAKLACDDGLITSYVCGDDP